MVLNKALSAIVLLWAIFLPQLCFAQEEAPMELKVSESAIAASIEGLTPEGISDTFPSSVSKVYAFSKIIGSKEETSIKHLWFYEDKLMAEVTLPIRSVSWRTYSSKRILPEWTGQWRVEITSEDGLSLKTLHFNIE